MSHFLIKKTEIEHPKQRSPLEHHKEKIICEKSEILSYFCSVKKVVTHYTSLTSFHGTPSQANRFFNHSIFLSR